MNAKKDFTSERLPHLLSNIDSSEAVFFEQAAALTGFDVFVNDNATDIYGRRVAGAKAVWTRSHGDHQEFWECIKELKDLAKTL